MVYEFFDTFESMVKKYPNGNTDVICCVISGNKMEMYEWDIALFFWCYFNTYYQTGDELCQRN